DEFALELIRTERAAGRFVPGLGHPNHKDGDPRTPVIFGIAAHEGISGPHLALFDALGRASEGGLGKRLPLNGAGVCGAALADLGFPPDILRGFALLARSAGLLGQISEEMRAPIANRIYMEVDRNARYVSPPE
ncbi:MAG: citrate/2-methylcitrate synthase, partial [Pseudonocardiaceae bacterium]